MVDNFEYLLRHCCELYQEESPSFLLLFFFPLSSLSYSTSDSVEARASRLAFYEQTSGLERLRPGIRRMSQKGPFYVECGSWSEGQDLRLNVMLGLEQRQGLEIYAMRSMQADFMGGNDPSVSGGAGGSAAGGEKPAEAITTAVKIRPGAKPHCCWRAYCYVWNSH